MIGLSQPPWSGYAQHTQQPTQVSGSNTSIHITATSLSDTAISWIFVYKLEVRIFTVRKNHVDSNHKKATIMQANKWYITKKNPIICDPKKEKLLDYNAGVLTDTILINTFNMIASKVTLTMGGL
ncbi:hypothetical protein ACJX0J_033941, partial [Zea mays]